MKPSRHLVHITGTLGSGGVQKLVLGLSSTVALASYRHSVVCLFGTQGDLADQFQAAGIHAEWCPFPWPNKLWLGSYRVSRWVRVHLGFTFPWRLAKLLDHMKADIVHTHVSAGIDLQAVALSTRARLPWVWTVHGLYRPEGRELRRWRKAVRVLEEANGSITADSEAIASDFVERGLARPGHIRVVRPGAGVLIAGNGEKYEQGWRTRFNIKPNAIVFGTSGRLVDVKGHDLFVKAAVPMIQGGSPAHFAIAGDGPLLDALRSLIDKLGISQRFHMLGFQSPIENFLREVDVFVLPSRSEGFPLALLEALAMKLPCIATRVGGVPEILGEDGGLMVAPESSEALCSAMRSMLSPELRRVYAERGPSKAQPFSFENCARQFGRIFESLLKSQLGGFAVDRGQR
ncbi:MAG: glycosyltransferase family 4 protein [Acidobacteria bacterium]|nr:glycosyltransferase family 4 protein [Acidobacteriota bacterium]